MSQKSVRRSLIRKLFYFFSTVALIVIAAVWLTIWHIAPRHVVQPPRTGMGATPPPGIESTSIQISADLHLAVWKARPTGKPRAALIMLHGICDSKASLQGSLDAFSRMGILALAPDLRGHGDSGGTASYGFHEKGDLARLLDSIKKDHPSIPVGLWGTSYGGAVALQAAAADPRFSFVIVESTFASFHQIGCDQVGRHAHPCLEWLAPIALQRAGELGNFDFTQINPAKAASLIAAPVLHLHGEKDEIISLAHAHRIQASAKGTRYQFISIPNGGHYNLRASDPTAYDRATSRFLAQVLPKR